jgi:hypothetical protein
MRTIRQSSGRPSPPSAHGLHFSFSQQQQSNNLDITLDPSRGNSQVLRDSNVKDSTQDYLEDSSLRVVPPADDRPGTPVPTSSVLANLLQLSSVYDPLTRSWSA